ncbi:MAG: hypothetical protein IKM41_04130, partial [Tidjanibacter sp.]|nr:hypothetical protein [Tidjanibacter sp.]
MKTNHYYTIITATLLVMSLLFGACTPTPDNGGKDTPPVENEWDKTTVKTYEYNPRIIPSIMYSVTANGENCFVYPCSEPHVATFSADGLVEVVVNYNYATIHDVMVRPQAKNYEWRLENDKIYLYLRPYDQVSVEINGDLENPLFVFVNPMEENKPDPEDPNVLYFAEGTATDIGTLILKDNQTFYAEGGAVVYGCTHAKNATNVTFAGCGIVDSRETGSTWGTRIEFCQNVKVENLLQFNHAGWSCAIIQCDNAHLYNYKIVAPHNPHNQYGI